MIVPTAIPDCKADADEFWGNALAPSSLFHSSDMVLRITGGGRMATKGQMTGMLGVYLVAAELSRLGFIVSPTSRSARGADLLVTDQECRKAWSIQVKTNRRAVGFWLVNRHASEWKSDSHAYVFVNLRGTERPEYLVAASSHVAEKVRTNPSRTGSVWYEFHRIDRLFENEGWELFGDPHFAEAEEIA